MISRSNISSAGVSVVCAIVLSIGQGLALQDHETKNSTQSLANLEGFRQTKDEHGLIVGVSIMGAEANDKTLHALGQIPTIRELSLQLAKPNAVTDRGVAALAGFTNLVSLKIGCGGQLAGDTFRKICGLTNLQHLSLVATFPSADNFSAITNLQQLTSLEISYVTNFSQVQLETVTNLSSLTNISLRLTGIQPGHTNILSVMPHLTKFELK